MKNPFIAGNWVRGENFFGRRQIVSDILDGTYNYAWIAGTRRFGKTSLLKQVEFLSTQPEYAAKYISLFWNMQGAGDEVGLIESLLESVEDVEDRFEAIGVFVEDLEGKSLSEILRILKRHARQQNLTLLLLCDECEELINVEKNNPEVMPKLRRIFQQGENLITILSATKRLAKLGDGLTPETSPFLHGFIPPVYLTPLEDAEAKSLINRGGFSDEVAEEIVAKSNNHPYLIQLICKRFFENNDLESVLQEMADDEMIAHFFAVDFDYLNDSEKQILWYVLQEVQVNSEVLEQKSNLPTDSISRQLHGLVQLGYLRKEGTGVKIANYFFEEWLKREKDRLFNEIAEAEKAESQTRLTSTFKLPQTFSGTTISHYEILEKIGAGGMGLVFKAVDQRLERTVALKMLNPDRLESPEFRERFFTEAKACSALNHQNIATLYEIDEAEGQLFISMEFVAGYTLAAWQKMHPQDEKMRFNFALQIAEGLKCAHSNDVIHRDIKPENILVNEENIIKITDFGLAKIVKDSQIKLTKSGTALGTLSYMSPEQTAGLAADHRSDIYSFGIVLFQLFTSALPYQSTNEAGLVYAIMNDPVPPASAVNPNIPPQLESILYKMMQKERGQRYQKIEDFIKDFKALEKL